MSIFRKARPGRGWGQEPGRAARSDLGRSLGEGVRGRVSLPGLVKALKMAGGNTACGARRRHRSRPSARLRQPTNFPQRPHGTVSAARNWLNWASAPRGAEPPRRGYVSRPSGARVRNPHWKAFARVPAVAPSSRLRSLPFPGRPVPSTRQ